MPSDSVSRSTDASAPADLALPQGYEANGARPTPLQLGGGRAEARRFPIYNGSDGAPMPATYQEFCLQYLRGEERPAVVYEVTLPDRRVTTIVVPADYDGELKADSKMALIRLAPADLPALLAELPDATMINEIVLLDERNPDDRWHEHERGHVFVTGATATPYGDVSIYKGCKGDEARTLLKHEWAHILYEELTFLSGKSPSHFWWKAKAAILVEADGFYLRDLARLNDSENFAVHMGECFLASGPTEFAQFVAKAPVRSRLFADILERVLWRSHIDMPYDDIYERRIRYAREASRASAAATLLAAANRTDEPKAHTLLVSLLAHYGSGDDLAAVTRAANFQLADDPFVGTATIERISRTPRIDALNISGARGVRPEPLALLAGTGIWLLSIRDCGFDDAAAEPISRLKTLKRLVAGRTRLSDAAIPHLAKLDALEEVYIEHTWISDEGRNQLQCLLPRTRIHFGDE